MPITYSAAAKTARMTATRDQVAGGTLDLLAANDTLLARFTLTGSGGTVSGAVWTLAFAASSVTGETGAGAGTAATKAVIKNSGDTAVITGLTVGTSAADVILDNTSIASGQTVTLGTATITHAA